MQYQTDYAFICSAKYNYLYVFQLCYIKPLEDLYKKILLIIYTSSKFVFISKKRHL